MDTNQPWSEQFRVAADEAALLDSEASLIEEMKSAVLAQRMNALGEMPINKAERIVRASPDWEEYIRGMVRARSEANAAKVKAQFMRMKFEEWIQAEYTKRAEMRL